MDELSQRALPEDPTAVGTASPHQGEDAREGLSPRASLPVRAPLNLVHPGTGEMLPATPENAAFLLAALREHRARVMDAIHDAEVVLLEESQRRGTKTLRLGAFTAKVSGGPEVVWDVEQLRADLVAAGCPSDRLLELIRETVEYRVSAVVAKQLAAANPAYAEAVAKAGSVVEKPRRVSVSG